MRNDGAAGTYCSVERGGQVRARYFVAAIVLCVVFVGSGCRTRRIVSVRADLGQSQSMHPLPTPHDVAGQVNLPCTFAFARLQADGATPLSDVERVVNIKTIKNFRSVETTFNLHPPTLEHGVSVEHMLDRARERGADFLFVYTFDSTGFAPFSWLFLLTFTLAPQRADGDAVCLAMMYRVDSRQPVAFWSEEAEGARVSTSRDLGLMSAQAAYAAESLALEKVTKQAVEWWEGVVRSAEQSHTSEHAAPQSPN